MPDTADIKAYLTEAELEAERLVSLLRMAAAVGLGLFFVITIRPAIDIDSPLLNRQWIYAGLTMAAYFALGFVLWRFSQRGWLRTWMIWPAATADSLFLVVNVWLSLDNTGLPGAAAFVLPPAWLVPLALAFGALRMNPWIQGYTALLIILGLAVLLDLRLGSNPIDAPPQYALFLSTPPNGMRLIMIALAGVLLVVAAARTRAFLIRSVRETRRRTNLTRFLPSELAPDLADRQLEDLRRGRRESMAILFVDMRNFTSFAEALPPAEVSDFMTAFRKRITRAADARGGMIDKFMGDAAMILFRTGPDPARACLTCARDLVSEMQTWTDIREASGQSPVRVGVGAHWGDVFSGVVGDDARLEYTVFGDAVNVAARLEAMTKDLNVPILVSGTLLKAAGAPEAGQTPIAQATLRGRDGTVAVHTVLVDPLKKTPGEARGPISDPIRGKVRSEGKVGQF